MHCRGDTISSKLDLSIDPMTNQKRDSKVVRELLQMRACSKIKNTSKQGEKVRNALVEKLWLEKQTGVIC